MNAATVSPLTPRRSTIERVNLSDITIDLDVQRKEGADQRRVDKIAANFDPDALGLLVLSCRNDGTLVCLDGMHRSTAAKQAGYKDTVAAQVFYSLTKAEEAALFLLYNDKKDPSAISKFHARMIAGDAVACAIGALVQKHGWRVATDKGATGVISAIAALERVYSTASGALTPGEHPEILDQTLLVLTDAWGHEPTATQKELLEAVAQLLGRFGPAVDKPKLIRELQGTQARRLVGQAKSLRDLQGGTVPAALAKILVGMHNNRRRANLLPDWVWVR